MSSVNALQVIVCFVVFSELRKEFVIFMGTKRTKTYHQQLNTTNISRLRDLLQELPSFCKDYFRGIEPTTTIKTRIGYAYDVRTFFRFLQSANPMFASKPISDIKLSYLDQLEPVDIEEYMEYLKLYTYDGQEFTNDERGIHRKMASLRSFYLYYQKRGKLQNNPTVVVDMPKLHDREIIRLDSSEVNELLELVEHGGDNLTGIKKTYYEKNRLRNIAIFTLFLGTGIRVSECVGLDIEDLDFRDNRIDRSEMGMQHQLDDTVMYPDTEVLHLHDIIIRKGGKEEFVYFGAEVREALMNYIEDSRSKIIPKEGHEHALFYSIQRRRISVQAVENLVTEYASQVTTFKHITPHKLRSTYGTSLYRQTGDIYLVAEVLGHNDVNTTRKHYAALDDDKKRQAASAVQLHQKKQR